MFSVNQKHIRLSGYQTPISMENCRWPKENPVHSKTVPVKLKRAVLTSRWCYPSYDQQPLQRKGSNSNFYNHVKEAMCDKAASNCCSESFWGSSNQWLRSSQCWKCVRSIWDCMAYGAHVCICTHRDFWGSRVYADFLFKKLTRGCCFIWCY